MATNLPPPKMPPLPGLGGANQPKMPPPEVQHAVNMAAIAGHANGLIALLAIEEIARLRAELKLAPLDLREAAADLEELPQAFKDQAHPAVIQFEGQARAIAGAKLRALADAQDREEG